MALSEQHQAIVDGVRGGVVELKNLMSSLTEYHGGPTATEYLLTGDIARVLVDRHFDGVAVECKYQQLVNVRTGVQPLPTFGTTRADIAIVRSGEPPIAVIEIKIRVTNFGHIEDDVVRLVTLCRAVKPALRKNTIGLVVFQISVRARLNWYDASRALKRAQDIEAGMQEELIAFRARHPDFEFTWVPLQGANEGAVGRELEGNPGDPDATLGEAGHATRYHSLLLQRK